MMINQQKCYLLQLPLELLQIITEYLSIDDLCTLVRTCQTLNKLTNTNEFWTHRIRSQFSSSITDLYTYDVFQKPTLITVNVEQCPTDFANRRNESELDRAGINSVTYFNDEIVEKRQAKMFVSKEDFRESVQYFQYQKPTNYQEIPLMKLVYFYLIDRKRSAIVDMDVVHRNDQYLVECSDNDSFKGRIIELQEVCWLEITGRFQSKIMPGKYQVIWRMRCPTAYIRIYGETEFIVVPTQGRLLNCRVSDEDFHAYAIEHDKRWFTVNMGEIIVYEPSIVHVAIRNYQNGSWKSGVAWDCIELKIVS